MPQQLYLRGLAIGFAVAFALGPIGLLVIRRTIERGWAIGLVSGLGVAAADGLYAAIAAFGLTALTRLLVGIDRPLGIAGGVVLLVLAWRALRVAGAIRGTGRARSAESARMGPAESGRASGPPVPDGPSGRARRLRPGRLGESARAWLTMVGLTLANPATILSFAALFASIGAGTGGPAGAAAVVAGVATGSVAWWLVLTALVAGLRARLTPRVIHGLNVASAVLIGGFGALAIGLGIAP